MRGSGSNNTASLLFHCHPLWYKSWLYLTLTEILLKINKKNGSMWTFFFTQMLSSVSQRRAEFIYGGFSANRTEAKCFIDKSLGLEIEPARVWNKADIWSTSPAVWWTGCTFEPVTLRENHHVIICRLTALPARVSHHLVCHVLQSLWLCWAATQLEVLATSTDKAPLTNKGTVT